MQTLLTLAGVAAHSAIIYVFLVLALSTLGRRQMLQISLLDYLIIALLGSAVETGLYLGGGSFWAGLVSAATLLIANLTLNRLQTRSPLLARLFRGSPVLLVHEGRILAPQLRRMHLTKEDLMAAIRLRGFDRLDAVRFAVMEANGEVTVVPRGTTLPGATS